MSSKVLSSPKIVFPVLLILIFITRLLGLNWGNGFFFHPDENNMAIAITRLSQSNLNPQFFAYGQFPLYLSFFSIKLYHFFFRQNTTSLAQAVFTLRFFSAIFSILSLYIFYQSSKFIFKNKRASFTFLLLIIFCPGLIQMAHFGTTESFLILVFSSNLYLSFLFLKAKKINKLLFLSIIITGLGLATKITALIFTAPVFLALSFRFLFAKNYKKFFSSVFMFCIFSFLMFLLASPYNLIKMADFLSSMKYETAVATGLIKVFYTNQFQNTSAYLFQILHIFPYTSGLPVFLLAVVGILLFLKSLIQKISKHSLSRFYPTIILTISSLVYFIYFGHLYTKWTRFMSPLFFLFPLLASFTLDQIKNKTIHTLITLFCLIPGLLFLNIYRSPDIRLSASGWINQDIPPDSHILSEGGNIINLPIKNTNHFNVNNFDFFTLDNNQEHLNDLAQQLDLSDYLLIPSRRIFKNQMTPQFPTSNRYYQALFSSKLGFTPIKQFNRPTTLFLNPEKAEETWTVFDNPTIRVYKKTTPFYFSDYQEILSE